MTVELVNTTTEVTPLYVDNRWSEVVCAPLQVLSSGTSGGDCAQGVTVKDCCNTSQAIVNAPMLSFGFECEPLSHLVSIGVYFYRVTERIERTR